MTDRERLTALLMASAGDFISKNGALSCTKLADYLLDHGVIVLPCKVGGTVYFVGATQVFDCTVNEINIKIIDEMSFSVFLSAEYVSENYGKCYTTLDWTEKKGKTVFLTREKAERELKERENNA